MVALAGLVSTLGTRVAGVEERLGGMEAQLARLEAAHRAAAFEAGGDGGIVGVTLDILMPSAPLPARPSTAARLAARSGSGAGSMDPLRGGQQQGGDASASFNGGGGGMKKARSLRLATAHAEKGEGGSMTGRRVRREGGGN